MNENKIETEKIERVVKQHVGPMQKQLSHHEEMHEKTQDLQTMTMAQMERLQEASDMQTTMILGGLPPDPEKPGMWRMVVDMHAWKKSIQKNWAKIKMTLILAAVGAIGTGIGLMIWDSFSSPIN